MKAVQINMTNTGSTGKIMLGIAQVARAHGHESWTFSPIGYWCGKKTTLNQIDGHRYFSSKFASKLHLYFAQLTGIQGCLSLLGALQINKALKEIKPDILHLHNLHNRTINLPLLFRYIKKHHIPVVWTLHDCWSFTGQCPHFQIAECDKWKHGCHHCPQIHGYPNSFVDNTRLMWKLKRKWFTGVENMTIITPSRWLADLVKQSYLKDYPVKVINNGIDLSVFKPVESNFRERHGIAQDKFLLLGVAFGWGKRKGLDVFIELSKRLDSRFQIVLVGTDEQTDSWLPENIISIHRTENQRELAEIYSAADLLVNPTREDTYPTVNMESIACGTPVLTFKTGGSPEIADESCGSVVDKDDIDAMEKEIIRICTERPYSEEACLNRAKEFDMTKRFEEYVELYTQGQMK